MTTIHTAVRRSFGPGVVSLVAVGATHLALTDIWHGDPDTALEWRVVQARSAKL